MEQATREPAVAGMFYPHSPADLEQQVEELIENDESPHDLLVSIAPHAGYVYSGPVAGKVFGHLNIPPRVVILGPNHTGLGAQISVASHRHWRTPMGMTEVDTDLGKLVLDLLPDAELDTVAHRREHSIEVQLPFLMASRRDVKILPICLKQLGLESCLELGRALAQIIADSNGEVGIIVSSDMSHYEPDQTARDLDRKAIDATLSLDPAHLLDTVRSNNISMCGVIPATAAIAAANVIGANEAHLVDYATSGDTSGDRSAVVGYAGICIHR